MPADTQKIKLLAIDDEPGVLQMIYDHFSLRGFEVFTAADGLEGIVLCERVRPQVILLDLKMKQLDGDKALGQLLELVPEAKIFVVSGYQDELAQKRIGSLAIEAYFEKPVSILEMEAAIRRSLSIASDSSGLSKTS